MQINDKAPEFTLPNEDGEKISLADYRGTNVVLFFYPKADTPGCTVEACEFRDAFRKIESTGAKILGISPDTSSAQKKFKQKYQLPYTLLADADKIVAKRFGVLKEKSMYGKKYMGIERTTFLIGPDGRISNVFNKVKPQGHGEQILAALLDTV